MRATPGGIARGPAIARVALLGGAVAVVAGLGDAAGPAPARAATASPNPTSFVYAGGDLLSGLGARTGIGVLGHDVVRTVLVPGRPAVPPYWEVEYIYNDFGDVIAEIRHRHPGKPAVPPRWVNRRFPAGNVAARFTQESADGGPVRATSLTVDVTDVESPSSIQASEVSVGVRRRGRRFHARLAASFPDGSRLRMEGSARTLSDVGNGAYFEVARGQFAGAFVRDVLGPGGIYGGYVAVPVDVGAPDFEATWSDSVHGSVTFFAPPSLAGRAGTIVRTGAGAYRVSAPGTPAVKLLVRANGSGWFDAGLGRQTFGAGAFALTDAAVTQARDAWDPADDVPAGATALLPEEGGTTPAHTLSHRDPEDWFRFDVTRPGVYGFSAPSSVEIRVFDPDLAVEPSSGFAATVPATYLVRVRATDPSAPVSYGLTWVVRTIDPGLWATRPGADLGFGYAVACDGDTAVVGIATDDVLGENSGAVEVYRRAGGVWSHEARLTASDAAAGDRFGDAVAVSGDTILAGAAAYNSNRNSAYVFRRTGDTWSEEAKLRPVVDAYTGFGQALALDGDRAVVGDIHGPGSVAVFERSGTQWTRAAVIASPESAPFFGWPVALSGGTIAVGTSWSFGRVYVFTGGGSDWSLQQSLDATGRSTASTDNYRPSLALDGDTLLVGALHDAGAAELAGAVFVFARAAGVWSQQAVLTAPAPGALDGFGASLAVRGEVAVVGNPGEDALGPDRGAAHVFVRSAGVWTHRSTLVSPSPGDGDLFGAGVAMSGATAIVGAPGDGDFGPACGSAWVLDGVVGE